ncbi:hypothetical protein [Foetidibacter luteolus]|uniref:hypothetical protein n=1 Tax=Foetidibacter luteolus TaxID=2608880 RepID=UPI00129BDD1C|nr:hypothetical protein [Foetidibacter luteolus]
MITINKKIKIVEDNQQVSIDLPANLPKGEYEVKLEIETEVEKKDVFLKSLEEWHKTGLKLDSAPTFRREDMYGDDGR